MGPQLFWHMTFFMLMCLGFMHIRYKNLAIISTTPAALIFDLKPGSYIHNGYCVFPNVIKAARPNANQITLVLHISYDRLTSSILTQINNWQSPISLALVFPKNAIASTELACSIQKLIQFKEKSEKFLSVHFVVENNATQCNHALFESLDLSTNHCPNTTVFSNHYENSFIQQMIHYPINIARNIARTHASTKYILIADMDHFFSKNFELNMQKLASKILTRDPKTVLVYRIFEVESTVTKYPETKEDLYELYKKNKAAEFHKSYKGHRIPRLKEWFNSTSNGTPTIQFYQKYWSYHWEPQFVSLPSIPLHDESFFYSTRDNTVLRWEMCRREYKFAIVNDVFMYHRGIKSRKEEIFLRKVRGTISKRANLAIRQFNQRMDKLYPETKKACPKFSA